jgi:hypothetical protein
MVRPVDLNDFYLQAEGAEKIRQIKKADPETEKKQFDKELAKKLKEQKKPASSQDETTQGDVNQEQKEAEDSKSDHIDMTV